MLVSVTNWMIASLWHMDIAKNIEVKASLNLQEEVYFAPNFHDSQLLYVTKIFCC